MKLWFAKEKAVAPEVPASPIPQPPEVSPEVASFYWNQSSNTEINLVRNLDMLVVAQIHKRPYEGSTISAKVNGTAVGQFLTLTAACVEVLRYIGGPVTNTTDGMELKS